MKRYCMKCGIATHYGDYCFDCFDLSKHDFEGQRQTHDMALKPLVVFEDDIDE